MGILLHVLAFYYQLGTSFPASYWAHDARIIKTHLLSSGNERKLVIIGGSNAYFGFSSGLIETATGLRVVNTSLHFDWPLDFFFSDVKPWLNPGDIVLLTLEYEYYQRETPFTNQFVSDMMSLEPQYFWNLNWRQRVEFFISVPPRRIAGGVLARLFTTRPACHWRRTNCSPSGPRSPNGSIREGIQYGSSISMVILSRRLAHPFPGRRSTRCSAHSSIILIPGAFSLLLPTGATCTAWPSTLPGRRQRKTRSWILILPRSNATWKPSQPICGLPAFPPSDSPVTFNSGDRSSATRNTT
jgi:hypothetical protein